MSRRATVHQHMNGVATISRSCGGTGLESRPVPRGGGAHEIMSVGVHRDRSGIKGAAAQEPQIVNGGRRRESADRSHQTPGDELSKPQVLELSTLDQEGRAASIFLEDVAETSSRSRLLFGSFIGPNSQNTSSLLPS